MIRDFHAAVVAAAVAAWPQGRVFKLGEVPSSPVYPYNVVGCDAGRPGDYRVSASHGSRLVRVTVQSVGRTFDEAGFAVERGEAAFLDQPLTVDGWVTTPGRVEITPVVTRDPDGGGVLYALATYLFDATPVAV